jgi:hypothetical protein
MRRRWLGPSSASHARSSAAPGVEKLRAQLNAPARSYCTTCTSIDGGLVLPWYE